MQKLNRDELITLAEKIRDAAGASEEENDQLLDLFLDNVPDPNAGNYFFDLEYDALTPAEIVDKALGYKPIQL